MMYRNHSEGKAGIRLSGNSCIVCGWCKTNNLGESLLIGAHVRPFSSGYEFDKSDNIIALCPNHHAEFDGFAFTIDSKTKQLIFLDKNDPNNGVSVASKITHIKENYLAYRQYQYNKANGIY